MLGCTCHVRGKMEKPKTEMVFVQNLNKMEPRAFSPNVGTYGTCLLNFQKTIGNYQV